MLYEVITYLEAIEDSLVDTSTILSTFLTSELQGTDLEKGEHPPQLRFAIVAQPVRVHHEQRVTLKDLEIRNNFV